MASDVWWCRLILYGANALAIAQIREIVLGPNTFLVTGCFVATAGVIKKKIGRRPALSLSEIGFPLRITTLNRRYGQPHVLVA
jgi:hypothetical protein